MQISGCRFLITGGASLVGSHLAEELLDNGAAEVIIYDNLSFGAESALGHLKGRQGLTIRRGDVMKLHDLIDAMKGVDGAFSFAAFMTLPMSRDPWTGLDVNIRGHQNLLEACRVNGAKKVIFASSSAAYGYGLKGTITEETPFHSVGVPPAAVIYGATKIIGEQLCADYGAKYGLDWAVLRFSTVYGERQHYRAANALYIIEAYDRVARGEPPVVYGDGNETKDFVYAGDVARACRMAMGSDVSREIMNISGGEEITTKALAELVLRLTGSNLKVEHRDPASGGVRLTSAHAFRYDNSKAKRVLGWEPQVRIEEGVRRLIEWRKANPGDQ
jgi:UDP-glucose 4-epimerase